MDPDKYGDQILLVLFHAIAFNYPDKPTDQEKEAHRKWFELFKDIIMLCGLPRTLRQRPRKSLENKEQLIKCISTRSTNLLKTNGRLNR